MPRAIQNSDGYHVDFVVCIDKASKYIRHNVEGVSQKVYEIYEKLIDCAMYIGKDITQVRIKWIAFGDYRCDEEPMVESPFFIVPDQWNELWNFFKDLHFGGDASTTKNALEAMALALRSDWTTGGRRQRHAIVTLCDTPPRDFRECADCPGYPEGMPANLKEFMSWWETGELPFESTYKRNAGRMFTLVPKCESWMALEALMGCCPMYCEEIHSPDCDIQILFGMALDTFLGALG